jgi:acyl-CoA synthetase (NDP forming)
VSDKQANFGVDGYAAAAQLQRMLDPASIALVGVSGRGDSAMSKPLRYLLDQGYAGDLYPVNPNYEQLQGVHCFPSLADVPTGVDLVLSFVSAERTLAVVSQAADIGAAAVIVFASGFAETGTDGAELQAELVRVARRRGIRLLGPNCQGLIYTPSRLFATFTAAADRAFPDDSGVAYVGQSGAVGGSVLDLASEMGLGLTAWVSTGNQADLDHVAVAETLLHDQRVRVIMIYAEGIADGRAFAQMAQRAQVRGVRLILLRTGRSEAGRRAAASHTGSMLGDDAALVLTCRRYGVILVQDVDELISVAAASSMRHGSGSHIAIVTTSGGAGSLTADQCEKNGLSVSELSASTKDELKKLVPAFGSVTNPVDVTAEILSPAARKESLGKVCTILLKEDADVVAVVLTMVTGAAGEALAEDLCRTMAKLKKSIFIAWLAGQEQTAAGREVYRAHAIPVFGSVSSMIRAIGLLHDVDRDASNAPPPVSKAGASSISASDLLDLIEGCAAGRSSGTELFSALGVSHPRACLATNSSDAAQFAKSAPRDVALKLHAPTLLHKSDIGGVRLNVAVSQVPTVFDELIRLGADNGLDGVEGVLVQDMLAEGTELLVALTSAADGFPPVLTVGFGGVATEIYRDVTSALAPVSPIEATHMLRKLKAWPLLDGYRGRAKADVEAAANAIAAVSRIADVIEGCYLELEINPLIVADEGHGAQAADILAQLDRPLGIGANAEAES